MRRRRILARDALTVLAAVAPAAGAQAAVATRFSADASGRAGVASDPFLVGGGDTGTAFVGVSLSPNYLIRDEFGSTLLRGHFGRTQYLSRYGSSHDFGATAQSDRRIRENVDFRAEVEFASSIISGPRSALSRDIADPVAGPGDPLDPGVVDPVPEIDSGEALEPLDPDIGLTGERQRRVSLAASTGIAWRPNAEENVDLGVRATRARYPGRTDRSNYVSYGASAAYSRTLSPTWSAGLSSSFDRTEYDGGGARTSVFQPQLTLQGRVNESWSIDAALGALLVRSEGPQEDYRSTGISADLRGCRQGPRMLVCLAARRGAVPTGEGNVTTRTGVELVASYRLSERETIQAAANYSRNTGRFGGLRELTEFVTLSQSYDRQISQRLTAGVNVEARLLYGALRDARDLSGTAFVRLRFGRII